MSEKSNFALPPRGNFVIRNAYVMTMDAEVGDLEPGDVHVDDGVIVGVGSRLVARGSAEVDGTDMIVMPGLIDTHTHLWTSQMRGRFGDTPDTAYFATRNRLAEGYLPADIYQGTRLGAAESIFSGITSVVDFFHNNRGAEYFDGSLRALTETGIRCRLLYGASPTMASTQSIDLAHLEQLAASWNRAVGEAPIALGMAWRGPLGIITPAVGVAIVPAFAVAKREFDTAQRLGLPICIHVSGTTAQAQFDSLGKGHFLGKNLQMVHFSNALVPDIRIAAESGTSVALTPMTELRVGFGITQLGDYLDGGMRLGLGTDSSSLAGAADLFSVMKLCQNLETGRLMNELAITPHQLLKLATIEGARSLGMDDLIGSVTVGKRADIIMVTTRALNMGRFTKDPAHLLVEAARPSNVDTVVVDGRILKRHGMMTALDPHRVLQDAEDSISAVVKRVHP
jgi:cytosine/adenosine deaminase-related metal-dependent hydrolase